MDLYCELIGGPRDGEVLAIPPGADGLPTSPLRLYQLQPDPVTYVSTGERDLSQSPVPTVVVEYERDRISDATHRWLYRWRS